MKPFLFFITLLAAPGLVMHGFGQNRIPEKDITSGYQLGFQSTTRGWGVSFHYLLGPDRRQWLIGLDANAVKDAREVRTESFFGQQGRDYVFGKLNHFVVLSPTVGTQLDLFPVGSGNMMNFRLGAKIGPAIGLTTPYYLEIFQPIPNRPQLGDRVVQAYDPALHTYPSIIGRAGIFSGQLDLAAQFGLSTRVYGMLDFSSQPTSIRAIQLGVNLDWFPSPVPIMADFVEVSNSQLFIGVSVGLMLGNRW